MAKWTFLVALGAFSWSLVFLAFHIIASHPGL